jgi:hypothetical protein
LPDGRRLAIAADTMPSLGISAIVVFNLFIAFSAARLWIAPSQIEIRKADLPYPSTGALRMFMHRQSCRLASQATEPPRGLTIV